MSIIEYRALLFRKVSPGIDWLNDDETLLSLCEGLIAVGSENNIQNASSLFKELEKQNNLGIDHLGVLKALLRGIEKWALIDEVEKFEVRRKNYVCVLEKIILKLSEYDVHRVIEICGQHLAADREGHINDVRALFAYLESRNRLGADCLEILKKILKETGEEDLLKEVEDFERKRKDEEIADRQRMESEMRREVRAAAVYAVPRAVGRMMGAVNVHCNFKTVGGVVVAVGAGVVLYKYSRGDSDIQQFANLFNEAILPAATNLCAIGNGSLCFTVQAENRSALQLLWQQYRDSTLQKNLQEFLVTEEIKQLSDSEDVIVTVHIDEQEFQDACLDLMMQDEVFSNEEDDRLKERTRRSSDSVVYVKPKENEVTMVLSKLKQAEIKFQQEKIDRLEKEISRIPEGNAEEELPLGDAQLDEQDTDGLRDVEDASTTMSVVTGFGDYVAGSSRPEPVEQVSCSEGDDRPMERRRRNSDSVVYVKPKQSEVTVVLSKLKQTEIESQQQNISSLEKEMVEYKAKVKELELMTESVSCSVKDDRPVERRRRNSDSVVYVNPKESEVEAVLSKLKQAWVEFQPEKLSRLEKEILKYKTKVKETELMMSQIVDEALMTPCEGVDKISGGVTLESGGPVEHEDLEEVTLSQKIRTYAIDTDNRSRLKAPIVPFELGFQEDETPEGVQVVEKGLKSKFTFVTRDLEGPKYYNADDQVTVKIQAPSGNVLKKKLEDSVDGTYTVSFTPDTVGPHSVFITVNGQPLTGSPWSVQVSPHQYKHVFTFGSRGSGPGKLNKPQSISINKNTDCIAVADSGNDRVQIFSADGSYLGEFGQKEKKAKRLSNPSSVAFTNNGDLLVLDSGRIFLYDESGRFIKQIAKKHLKKAWLLSVAPEGNVIVYDGGDNNIKAFSPDGAELLHSFRANPPEDIVYHQETFFATCFSENCVKVYNREGVFLYDIGSKETGDGHLYHPSRLAIDKFKNLIVCNQRYGKLKVFSLDGQYVNTIGEKRTMLGRLKPSSEFWDVAVSKTGRVYTTDIGKDCVDVFQ